ncbi:MAG: single-stranded DNA-binding protein [Solirubrobacterales bacterium]|nr:single-stranded DNA-binding protein [Solirubrobacterales bacterium]
MAQNINRVVLTGRLTSDADLRDTASGMKICKLRVACNGRAKDPSGNWGDKPNFFDVTVFGPQGENAARYLSKGSPVAIDGRLDWREWEDKETGKKRSAVGIIADSVQFLGGRDDSGGGGGGASQSAPSQGFSGGSDVPADTSDFQTHQPAPVGGGSTGEDDIPF